MTSRQNLSSLLVMVGGGTYPINLTHTDRSLLSITHTY
nr:MAG TPA: hypothetical protein [Caudoviricetes sp.]